MNNQMITAADTTALMQTTDEAIMAAEADYVLFEVSLLDEVSELRTLYSDAHSLDTSAVSVTGHDPYDLMAILSAIKPDWQMGDTEIQRTLETLKEPRHQYTLVTSFKNAQTRETINSNDAYRYDHAEMDVAIKLTNYDLECVVDSLLKHDQLCAYAGYQHSKAANLEQFNSLRQLNEIHRHQVKLNWTPRDDELAPSAETLAKYPALRQMISIATPFIGYPYVWGGNSPETSFDCSGFVDYILDEMGYHYRNEINGQSARLPVAGSRRGGAFYDGIYEKCTPINETDARPGDLVFFGGTFDASYREKHLTHVGIYLGDEKFLACSDGYGVAYLTYDDHDANGHEIGRTWRELLAGYGRLPIVEENI